MPPAADTDQQARYGDEYAVHVTQNVLPSEVINLVAMDRIDDFLATRTPDWMRVTIFLPRRWV